MSIEIKLLLRNLLLSQIVALVIKSSFIKTISWTQPAKNWKKFMEHQSQKLPLSLLILKLMKDFSNNKDLQSRTCLQELSSQITLSPRIMTFSWFPNLPTKDPLSPTTTKLFIRILKCKKESFKNSFIANVSTMWIGQDRLKCQESFSMRKNVLDLTCKCSMWRS